MFAYGFGIRGHCWPRSGGARLTYLPSAHPDAREDASEPHAHHNGLVGIWGRIVAAVALVAILLGNASPSAARLFNVTLDKIPSPVAGGSEVTVTASTVGDGQSAFVSLQVSTGSGWKTVDRQQTARWASTVEFNLTAPKQTSTLSIRVVMTRDAQTLATSRVATLKILSRGLTPASPHRAHTRAQSGDWFSVGRDLLRFGPTRSGLDAWRVVSPETATVDKPAPGWSIVLGTVSYKPITGKVLDHLFYNLRVTFRGSNGKEYRGYNVLSPGGTCGYSLDLQEATGNRKLDTVPVPTGGSPQFYPCAVVPNNAINGGTWMITATSIATKPAVQYAQVALSSEIPFPKGITPIYPYSVGDSLTIPFVYGTYGVRFGATLTDEDAWKVVDAVSPIAEHPAPGWSIVLVTGTIENRTSKPAAPFLEIVGPTFVGNDGVKYPDSELSSGGHCPWIPTDLYGRSLDPYSSMTFTACTVAPDEAIAGGVWQLGPFNPFVLPQALYVTAAVSAPN